MMWNTFIVKRLSAATYLMDKVNARISHLFLSGGEKIEALHFLN